MPASNPPPAAGPGRTQFSSPIECPECGHTGAAIWEEDDGLAPGKRGPRYLIQISLGFRSEAGKTPSGDPLIVCDICNHVQPD